MAMLKNTDEQTESRRPGISLLKLLGFVLLVGSVTSITLQSAILAISGWS